MLINKNIPASEGAAAWLHAAAKAGGMAYCDHGRGVGAAVDFASSSRRVAAKPVWTDKYTSILHTRGAADAYPASRCGLCWMMVLLLLWAAAAVAWVPEVC